MAVSEIPVFDLPAFNEVVQLDGEPFRVFLRWVGRTASWAFSIETGDGVRLVSGQRLVSNQEIVRRLKNARRPAGKLTLTDVTDGAVDPGRDELGTRARLLYVDAVDVARIATVLDDLAEETFEEPLVL